MNHSQPDYDALLALDNQLCFALYSASHAMTRLYRPLLAPLGLTYPQYMVMLVLWEQDGLTVNEIGAKLFLDSGTLTPLLKRLQSAQLLSRERDTADERRVLIRLTESGKSLREQAKHVPEQLLGGVPCPLQQQRDLTRQIAELRDQLQTHLAALTHKNT